MKSTASVATTVANVGAFLNPSAGMNASTAPMIKVTTKTRGSGQSHAVVLGHGAKHVFGKSAQFLGELAYRLALDAQRRMAVGQNLEELRLISHRGFTRLVHRICFLSLQDEIMLLDRFGRFRYDARHGRPVHFDFHVVRDLDVDHVFPVVHTRHRAV